MTIRERLEKREEAFLSPFACLSSETLGRERPEEPCSIRSAFQVDRDRIVYSNAFRRLKYKTQVFLAPLGDYYRTRLTHTLEVSQMARNIARAMLLNEDLTEAIALGHDLGHPPFGHSGEMALREIYSPEFCHNEQSVRVVEQIENKGRGLNLTFEVRDGIRKHSKGYGKIIPDDPAELAVTYEGRIVRIADIMAYLNHDLDDAIRSGVIQADQVPPSCVRILGETHSQRATSMIRDLVFSSETQEGELVLRMSDPVYEAMSTLRAFLYENVYRSERVHNEFIKAKKILSELYECFMETPGIFNREKAAAEMAWFSCCDPSHDRNVCDFIASMTDRCALNLYSKIFFPSPTV
jgi:dGTPase